MSGGEKLSANLELKLTLIATIEWRDFHQREHFSSGFIIFFGEQEKARENCSLFFSVPRTRYFAGV